MGNLNKRDHLEDLGVDGRIYLKGNLRNRIVGVDWIDVDEDKDRWWAVVKTVVNFHVAQKWEISWLTSKLLAPQEGLCSAE